MTFSGGGLDHVIGGAEDGDGIGEWRRSEPWCGQTAFTFPANSDSRSEPQDAAGQDPSCSATGVLPSRRPEGESCQVTCEVAHEVSDFARSQVATKKK